MGKEIQIRSIAQAVIRRVLIETTGPVESVAAALEAAYPFGTYHGSAYQIWRDETRRALSNRRTRGAAA